MSVIITAQNDLTQTFTLAAIVHLESRNPIDPEGLDMAESLATRTQSPHLLELCMKARKAITKRQAQSRRDARVGRIVDLRMKGEQKQLAAEQKQLAADDAELEALA